MRGMPLTRSSIDRRPHTPQALVVVTGRRASSAVDIRRPVPGRTDERHVEHVAFRAGVYVSRSSPMANRAEVIGADDDAL